MKANFKIVSASTAIALVAFFAMGTLAPTAFATDVRQKREVIKKKPRPTPAPKKDENKSYDSQPIVIPPMRDPLKPMDPTIPNRPLPPIPGFPDFPEDVPAPGLPDGRGPEVPFPMSTTLPFPWEAIEGTWNAKGNGIDLFFSFKVEVDHDGREILTVNQVDAKTGALVAQGLGLSVENDKLVRAAMNGTRGGSYMLFIGSYKDPKSMVPNRFPRSVTVLTVRSFTNLEGEEDEQFTVSKVSNLPYSAENPLPKCPDNN